GKLVVYASDRAGGDNLDLWLQQIGGGAPFRLTFDPADEYEPSFSPDGARMVFRSERDGGGVYVMPALGGEPILMAKACRQPGWPISRLANGSRATAFCSRRNTATALRFSKSDSGRRRGLPTHGGWTVLRAGSPPAQDRMSDRRWRPWDRLRADAAWPSPVCPAKRTSGVSCSIPVSPAQRES